MDDADLVQVPLVGVDFTDEPVFFGAGDPDAEMRGHADAGRCRCHEETDRME